MSMQVRGLSAAYGQAQVLWDVDFEVDDGEVVGILGRNGAGKTTLLRALCGLHPQVRGQVRLDGVDVAGKPADQIARRGISVLREGGKCASSLTVLQHLGLGQRLARLRGQEPVPLEDVWRWFPLLVPLEARKAGLLSGGQRQALALAVAFVARPRWILLDEPSAGLAPPVARDLFATISQLASTGVTVLVVEQAPAWLQGIASKAYLLEVGRIVSSGPMASFAAPAHAGELM
jgi:branched-chain amino acid transport system ATP-binding protein